MPAIIEIDISADMSQGSVRKRFLQAKLARQKRAVFFAFFLDRHSRLIQVAELFNGTVNSVTVYPREVLRAAYACDAEAVFCARTDPGGDSGPSQDDIINARRLNAAFKLAEIPFYDYFIAGKSLVSLARRGCLLTPAERMSRDQRRHGSALQRVAQSASRFTTSGHTRLGLAMAPERGRLVIVNFEMGGTSVGIEMRKSGRPCIVIQNNKLDRGRLVTVVPLSTTAPLRTMPWHHKMDHRSFRDMPRDYGGQELVRWAKCDCITTVSLDRCADPHSAQQGGGRKYTKVRVTMRTWKPSNDVFYGAWELIRHYPRYTLLRVRG